MDHGLGVMCNGSCSCDSVTTGDGWEWLDVSLHHFAQHSGGQVCHRALGTTILAPRTTSPSTTDNSTKMGSYWGPSTLFYTVKYPPTECVSSSSYCQVTVSGTDDFTIAMMSFSNSSTVSLRSNSAWFLLAWLSCATSGSG